jgi:hypothetical protein
VKSPLQPPPRIRRERGPELAWLLQQLGAFRRDALRDWYVSTLGRGGAPVLGGYALPVCERCIALECEVFGQAVSVANRPSVHPDLAPCRRCERLETLRMTLRFLEPWLVGERVEQAHAAAEKSDKQSGRAAKGRGTAREQAEAIHRAIEPEKLPRHKRRPAFYDYARDQGIKLPAGIEGARTNSLAERRKGRR